ncbi:MAG: dethiobiotin synthase [Verrucomicrobia bacterium]|nr:dethiobiotin synthase [Verrucomicrobiota bacterium]
MKRIAIVGINTEVGKTVVSAVFAEALGARYWKPVQCGAPSDEETVQNWIGNRCYPSSYFLKTPCSPHLAARLEGTRVESQIEPPEHEELLIIEGTGGIFAPLNETDTWADAAMQWDAGWVLVHRHYLGSLNHFLLTLDAMQRRRIPLLGVVFNGEGDLATEEMLIKKASTRCLGRLKWETQLNATTIRQIANSWKKNLRAHLGL